MAAKGGQKMKGIRAELYKYKKRKVYMLSIPLLIIPVLLALNSIFLTDPYATRNQSLLYWSGIAIFMNSMMYVVPIIFSYVSGLNLSEEIENRFFGVINQRCNKVTVYRSKMFATIIVTTRLFLMEIVGCIIIYYLTYFLGGVDLTGRILGEGYNIEAFSFIVEMFLFYCILIPVAISGISTYITDKNKLIISFVIVIFIGRIIPSNTIFNYIIPWNILRKFSQIETGAGGNNLGQSLFSIGNSLLVTLVVGLTCYFLGKNRIRRINL